MSQASAFESDIEKQLSQWVGVIPILIPIFQRLNVVSIINRYCPTQADIDQGMVALILGLNRLMAPRPLYKVADWFAETILAETLGIPAEKLHDRRIGDLLDAIYPHLDNIWREIVHQAINEFGIDIEFIHYDITSTYFEGAYDEAELLQYGYSRDKQSDCKQVNLRLNVTGDDGIPLAYKVISGNTADRTTPIENMHALRETLKGLPVNNNLVIVSDQAMLCPDVILEYHQQGIGYLGPLPNHKVYESVLMSVSTDELKAHPLGYRPQNQKSDEPPIYYGVLSKVTISGQKTNQSIETDALILYSSNKAKLDRQKRETLLTRYLLRLKEIEGHLNKRRYKKATYTLQQIQNAQNQYKSVKSLVDVQLCGSDGELTLCFDVNEHQLAAIAERDGRYLLVTHRPLSANEMLTHFKQQDKVEKRNRTIKGPIQIRPIFLHNPQRIEALIFICMVALLAFSILELLAKQVGYQMTGTRIIDQFSTLRAVYTVFNDKSYLRQLVPLSEFQQQFISALQMSDPKIYLHPLKIE